VPLVGLTTRVRLVVRVGVELPIAVAPLQCTLEAALGHDCGVTYRRAAPVGDVVAAVASIHSSGRRTHPSASQASSE